MSSSLNRIKKNIIEAMQSANNQGTSAYDSVAEVRRVEGDTAWVHIAGGVDETPVKLTIAAKVGDVVQVRVGGGRAWITGNASAPPTDDKTAIVAKSLANIAGNRAKTAQKTADQAQIVADSALEGTKENATQMAQMVIDFNGDIENLQDQIDGNIATWFYDVDPTMDLPPVTDWDTDEKKDAHLGDIYYNTVKGYAWRFMKSGSIYSWERITDTDVTKALADAAKAQDTADSKRRVFYNTPTVPYDAGDLWVQGSGGDILRCAQAKKSTGSYDRNDWVLASKYTDDSALNTWIEGDFATTIQGLEEGLVDAKIETYYQTTDPSTGWSDIQKSEHKGDLWYNSTASVQKYYRWSGTAWQELTATPPQAVFDNIDKKATIYTGTTTPTNPDSGDLWFKGADEPILTYVNNSWVEYNKYTDDTRAEQAIEDAANAAKVATNFMEYDGTNGLVLGNKESGSWVGYRTQIDKNSFNVLDENGNTISSYGSNEVELGKGNPNAIIKMCDGKAYVKNFIVGSQNTSVFCGQEVTVVGEWEGASEAYALFKQGFVNIGQSSSHVIFSSINGKKDDVEIKGRNITMLGASTIGNFDCYMKPRFFKMAGEIKMWAGDAIPDGWLLCDGSEVSKTEYPYLYASIGDLWGVPNSSSNFKLPNLNGKVPVGYDSSDTDFATVGHTDGEKTHTLSVTELPSHRHPPFDAGDRLLDYNYSTTGQGVSERRVALAQSGNYIAPVVNSSKTDWAGHDYTGNAGGGAAHNNLQPYAVVKYIICAF